MTEYFCLLVVELLLVLPASGRKPKCQEQTDCNCGEVCVFNRQSPCRADQGNCRCRRGCVLEESRNVYCNLCSCDADPAKGSIIPCDLPADFPLYHQQPQCPDPALVQNFKVVE